MAKEWRVNLKDIKARVSMELALRALGLWEAMAVKGERAVGKCAIHGGDNPGQLSCSLVKGCFQCFSCKAKGSVVDLVAGVKKCSIAKAAELLDAWYPTNGAPLPVAAKAPQPVEELPPHNVPLTFQLKLDDRHPYLGARGITPELALYFGLGVAGRGSMKGRLCIPIHDEGGQLVAYAGRWAYNDSKLPEGEGRYKLPPKFHKSRCLYNLNRVPADTNTAVLVEGYFSVFQLYRLGHLNAVAAMGSSLSEQQLRLLSERFSFIYVLFDGDEAGRKGAGEAARLLAPHVWVKVVTCPEGKQPDQLSAEEVAQLVKWR